MKEEPKDKTAKDVLLTETGQPDEEELFYFQLPCTLPISVELGELANGARLGKLQVLKNGKTRMVFENGLELEVNRGIEASFY